MWRHPSETETSNAGDSLLKQLRFAVALVVLTLRYQMLAVEGLVTAVKPLEKLLYAMHRRFRLVKTPTDRENQYQYGFYCKPPFIPQFGLLSNLSTQ